MCVDANRGAREAARQRKKEKDFAYAQEGLKFHNREFNYEKTLDANVIGYSRSISDAYSKALYTQAKGRKELENAAKLYFSKKSTNEGGRSRRFGLKQYQALLQAKAEVQGINRTNFGRNMAVAQEGARNNITANTVAPGYVDTEMVAAVPQNVLDKIVSTIPVGRLGHPEEIARAVAFLAREDSQFVTGSTISINGGHHMY